MNFSFIYGSKQDEFAPFQGEAEGFSADLHAMKGICQIFSVKGILFALSLSGLCSACNQETKTRICYLNQFGDEKIQKFFYNKSDDCLITVCAYSEDNYESVRCWSTLLMHIKRNILDLRQELFVGVNLRSYLSVKFDSFNDKAIIKSMQDETIQVFDLKTYTFLFEVPGTNSVLTSSPGIVVVISSPSNDSISVRVASIDDGDVVTQFNHELNGFNEYNDIVPLSEKVLLLDPFWRLHVLNLLSSRGEARQHFRCYSDSIILPQDRTFLTLNHRVLRIYNSDGNLITNFEDHALWQRDFFLDETHITNDKFIISKCHYGGKGNCENNCREGHIHISCMKDGKRVAKLCGNDPACISHPDKVMVSRALKKTISIFYDEECYELYTGNIFRPYSRVVTMISPKTQMNLLQCCLHWQQPRECYSCSS